MRLLLVEDEQDLRTALAKSLEDDGYAVDQAEDGEEGLYKAVNVEYDAIILDLMLPLLDGWEVLSKLREERQTPVLILTARGDLDDRVKGLDLGSDDFVVKPFELQELLARLRALIRRTAGEATTQITHNKLSLDTAKRSVKYDGKPVELTPREYRLIEYMIMHRGRMITRTELYEHIFDDTDDSLSNVLDVYVCNVRRKTNPSLIKTKRGHGYVVED